MKPGMYFKAGEENPLFDFQLKFGKNVEIDDITYEDYLIYKQMEVHKKFLAPGYEKTTLHTITSALWAIAAIASGITFSPWMFLEFINTALFGSMAVSGYVATTKDKEHKKYHQLYKYFKKKNMWDKLKSYMLVYKQSYRFEKDKAEYEYKQANEKLEKYITHASFEINDLTNTVRSLKHEYEQHLPEQERTPDVKFEVGEDKIVMHKDDTSDLYGNISVGKMIRELTCRLADKKVKNVEITFNEADTSQPTTETEQISIDEINK